MFLTHSSARVWDCDSARCLVWTFFLCSAKKNCLPRFARCRLLSRFFRFVVWFYLGSYLVAIKNEMTRETHKKKPSTSCLHIMPKSYSFCTHSSTNVSSPCRLIHIQSLSPSCSHSPSSAIANSLICFFFFLLSFACIRLEEFQVRELAGRRLAQKKEQKAKKCTVKNSSARAKVMATV